MIRRFLIPILLCLSFSTDYQIILKSETARYQVDFNGQITLLDPLPTSTPLPPPEIELPFQPLFAPIYITTSHDRVIFSLSGKTDPYTDLYGWMGATWQRLTDVISLYPANRYLSASAEWISPHPEGFLYRARARDADGRDHNTLYFYNWENQTSEEMPFFGKDPVFSPDGRQLVGGRLNEDSLLYELWLVDLETQAEQFLAWGCNPQWSSDGRWIAYDDHDNSQWQGYTDCFVNGEVLALNLATGEKIALSATIDEFVTLAGWQ